ncbi:hypothetical protein [Brevundimonas sp.]|jgi:hypothetical protein|uniref:hypothetical protein n=1 Tax=Brevundimonas sp. TaxID=1871086 RepID=UPI002AB9CF81|nr:hypothetical protein [Brevundimonas sp.]MDZ4364488.1 hypothetical protein [Brevundimonas sp.]
MSEPLPRSPLIRFLAWLLMAVGVLIALTAGACSLIFMVIFLPAGTSNYFGDLGDMILLLLTVGGIPLLIGLALFFGGLRLSRPSRTRTPTNSVRERDDEPTTGA